jgi:hypothetical protein
LSGDIIQEERQIRYVFRKKITTIIKEEELITEHTPSVESGGLPYITQYKTQPISRRSFVDLECKDALIIDDLEERKELTRIMGFSDVPKKKEVAFEKIKGIFDDLMGEKEIDAVELVKELRKRR